MSSPSSPLEAASASLLRPESASVEPAAHGNRRDVWSILARIAPETKLTVHATLTCSAANLLLFCVPLGIVAGARDWAPVAVFIINFFAIFPLASVLTFSTEQLAKKVGTILGGLVNATFGNAVEMIVGLNALRGGETRIVQWSMVGSILSSVLLILGSCFMVCGWGQQDVQVNREVAGILTSLSIISSASLIIPSALQAAEGSSADSTSGKILGVSYATCIVLLAFYLLFLYFQTWSHSHFFADTEEDPVEEGAAELSILASSAVLVLATLGVSVCSDYLVDSVGGFVDSLGISRAFVGLIIVPILGNASQFVATIQWSLASKANLAVGLTVSSTLQISLFVTPFLVLMGWVLGQPMSLQFDTFETIVLALAVLVVSSLVRDGRSNYFEGCLLVMTYVIVAIAFFYKPDIPAA